MLCGGILPHFTGIFLKFFCGRFSKNRDFGHISRFVKDKDATPYVSRVSNDPMFLKDEAFWWAEKIIRSATWYKEWMKKLLTTN
jgi:hypothetical protein